MTKRFDANDKIVTESELTVTGRNRNKNCNR